MMKVKEETEKAGLKLNIQKTKIMACSPITSWQIDGETVETVTGYICLGSKITADGDCSHEIKRHLLLGRKAMTNWNRILSSRDITLPAKVLVKTMVFPVVMSECESWTIKKAEQCWIDASELWCWRRLLRVRWKSTLNIHWKDWCWSWSSSPLATEVKTWLTRKDPDAGKDWRQQEKVMTEEEMVVWHHQLDGHEFEQTPGVGDGQGSLVCCSPWGHKKSGTTEWLNWTEFNL